MTNAVLELVRVSEERFFFLVVLGFSFFQNNCQTLRTKVGHVGDAEMHFSCWYPEWSSIHMGAVSRGSADLPSPLLRWQSRLFFHLPGNGVAATESAEATLQMIPHQKQRPLPNYPNGHATKRQWTCCREGTPALFSFCHICQFPPSLYSNHLFCFQELCVLFLICPSPFPPVSPTRT